MSDIDHVAARRILVVLNVNMIVSGFLKSHGAPGVVVDLWRQDVFDVAISEHIVRKVEEVWSRPYFTARASDIDFRLAAKLLEEQTKEVDPDTTVTGVAHDAEDDLVLGTAVAADAGFLVTGDRRLLAVRSSRDVRIMTAREFLALIDS